MNYILNLVFSSLTLAYNIQILFLFTYKVLGGKKILLILSYRLFTIILNLTLVQIYRNDLWTTFSY